MSEPSNGQPNVPANSRPPGPRGSLAASSPHHLALPNVYRRSQGLPVASEDRHRPLYPKSYPDHPLPLPLIAHSPAVTSSLRWIRVKKEWSHHGVVSAGLRHFVRCWGKPALKWRVWGVTTGSPRWAEALCPLPGKASFEMAGAGGHHGVTPTGSCTAGTLIGESGNEGESRANIRPWCPASSSLAGRRSLVASLRDVTETLALGVPPQPALIPALQGVLAQAHPPQRRPAFWP